ncbi:MAG: hypothetical protein JW957_07100 [Candidatus Omnitrophica bacterium]|nr:hypothetical protein [Candidatus Omnitrophota bacterium]
MKMKSPVAGAVLGTITFTIFGVVERLFSRREAFFGSGLGQLLLGAVILGIVVGSVVAALVDKTRNRGAGILIGAVIVGLLHGFGVSMAGIGGGFRIFAMIWGAVYGAVAGALISSAILEACEKER